jgi:hypothetical protein
MKPKKDRMKSPAAAAPFGMFSGCLRGMRSRRFSSHGVGSKGHPRLLSRALYSFQLTHDIVFILNLCNL